MEQKDISHETLLAIAIAAVLVGMPFIGWEYEIDSVLGHTEPPGLIQITIYLVLFSLGLMRTFMGIIKNKISDQALLIKSALIAVLFTPLIMPIPTPTNWTAQIIFPSGLIIVMDSGQRLIDIPLHHFTNPIAAFLLLYSVMKTISLRYHYDPSRILSWCDVIKIYLKSKIRLITVFILTLGAAFTFFMANHLWVERGYMPRSIQSAHFEEGGIGEIRLQLDYTNDNPVDLFINFWCGDNGETEKYYKIILGSSGTIACLMDIWLKPRGKEKTDVKFSNDEFVLRDPGNPTNIYPSTKVFQKTVHNRDNIAIDETCRCEYLLGGCVCELQYVFEGPPKEVELVLPEIYINGVKYKLHSYIFEYHEYLKYGTPDRSGQID
jgi:hypothetical protein